MSEENKDMNQNQANRNKEELVQRVQQNNQIHLQGVALPESVPEIIDTVVGIIQNVSEPVQNTGQQQQNQLNQTQQRPAQQGEEEQQGMRQQSLNNEIGEAFQEQISQPAGYDNLLQENGPRQQTGQVQQGQQQQLPEGQYQYQENLNEQMNEQGYENCDYQQQHGQNQIQNEGQPYENLHEQARTQKSYISQQYEQIPVQQYREEDFFINHPKTQRVGDVEFKFVGIQDESEHIAKDIAKTPEINESIVPQKQQVQIGQKNIPSNKQVSNVTTNLPPVQMNKIQEKKVTQLSAVAKKPQNIPMPVAETTKVQNSPKKNIRKQQNSKTVVISKKIQDVKTDHIKQNKIDPQKIKADAAIKTQQNKKAQQNIQQRPIVNPPKKLQNKPQQKKMQEKVVKVQKKPQQQKIKHVENNQQKTVQSKKSQQIQVTMTIGVKRQSTQVFKVNQPASKPANRVAYVNQSVNENRMIQIIEPIKKDNQIKQPINFIKQLPRKKQIEKNQELLVGQKVQQKTYIKQFPKTFQAQQPTNFISDHKQKSGRTESEQYEIIHKNQPQTIERVAQNAQVSQAPKSKKKKKKHRTSQSHHDDRGELNPQIQKLTANPSTLQPRQLLQGKPLISKQNPNDRYSLPENQPKNNQQMVTAVSLSVVQPLAPNPSELQTQPPLTSQFIIHQAEKERMWSTYQVFLKYIGNYTKAITYYKNIINNVFVQINRKKNYKNNLLNTLLNYFQNYAQLNQEFNQECYKLVPAEVPGSQNPFGNIRLELRRGFDEIVYLRKTVANEYHKISTYVTSTIIPGITKAFAAFNNKINAEQQVLLQKREVHRLREKLFYKVISQVDKVFNKGVQGKYKIDILSQIARLINEEQGHRQILRAYGRTIVPLRLAYINAEKQLFESLQILLNQFKNESKLIYSVGRRQFHYIQDLTRSIKEATDFKELSPLTDLDYIQYVLEIQQKKQTNLFKNHHFEHFLQMKYFDPVVGPIRRIYKGTVNKIFPLAAPHEQLIHTISGNLVQFNREMDQCLNVFVMSNINAKIISPGLVEFDEVIKGIFFDDNRTMRVKMKDQDRAEELICYLNQKEENIVVDRPPYTSR